jgi:putative (di)nucleoside polyphosphate hydrolase
LRGGVQMRDRAFSQGCETGFAAGSESSQARYPGRLGAAFELPPGATFEPDPQTSLDVDSCDKKI